MVRNRKYTISKKEEELENLKANINELNRRVFLLLEKNYNTVNA